MTNREITKFDDVIDSRDVIERIEELETALEEGREGARAAFADEYRGTMTVDEFAAEYINENMFEEAAELKTLLALQEEAKGYAPDWKHGATLVRDSHFRDYAEELAEDIGAIQAGATWPNNCIDWDEAARQLKMDYTSVEFDGVTYWVR